MSPLTLRRFRAERLLRTEFEQLRVKVLGAVQARLAARGLNIARADLDACYSMAWHGLYAAQISGEPIETPEAWLTLVTFRRALDEHRARGRLGATGEFEPVSDPDLAGALDDRAQLAALFEGIREALSAREREAAALCYLHGLSRAEAAERMGIGARRMRKLMDGRGAGSPGVAAKVGTLAETIERGEWCEGRASLMRALAFGILAPGGERHRLALAHQRNCPACRAYVASLRGLAAVLPPWALPPGLLAALTAGGGAAGGGAAAAGTGAGAAGAGGGWALAGGGPLGAKLAVGCLLLVGTGCATLGVLPGAGHGHGRADRRRAADRGGRVTAQVAVRPAALDVSRPSVGTAGLGDAATSRTVPPGPDGAATREFGIEGGAQGQPSSGRHTTAAGAGAGSAARAARASSAGPVSAPEPSPVAAAASAESWRAAAREFSPG